MRRPGTSIRTTTRLAWLVSAGAPLIGLVPSAFAADPFAASVLSCAAETDRDRRLDCYDRAVAGFTAKLGDGKRDGAAGAAAVGSAGAAESAGVASVAAPPPTASVTTAAAVPPGHLTARVTRVDYFPDHVIVHLDNNQVWQQVSEASGDANLRAGDEVTVDKQMGSYWLSGHKGVALQVKLKAAPAP